MFKMLLQRSLLQRVQFSFKNEKSFLIAIYKTENARFNLTHNLHFHISSPARVVVISQENNYAFGVVSKFPSKHIEKTKIESHQVESLEEFNNVLEQNWRNSSVKVIVEVFRNVTNFCIQHNIDLSDKRFDNLVDGVVDNCEHLTKDEMVTLLSCIAKMPVTESYQTHNFHDLWSCLDDICCYRLVDWDVDTCLEISKEWYRLHLGRLCDFNFALIDRMSKKTKLLNKNQLVKIFFCFNMVRSRAVDFEYEYALEHLAHEMDVDELAVVALGYFKTKTKIKIVSIMKIMIERVTQNSETINEISLSAILKVLRASNPSKLIPEVNQMLDKLCKEINRLSEVCCLHIALLGTGYLQYCHTESLKKVCEKLITNISNPQKIRLKDIERILLALTLFNFDPKTTPDIFRESFQEIHKESRVAEEIKYVRSLLCTLYYLSIKNIYSYELMNKVLDKDYIETNFGKSAKMLPRELLALDCSIDIECPGYKGTRLTPEQRYRGAKWLAEFFPTLDYKVSQAGQLFLEVLQTIKEIVDEECILLNHILPHFSKADIILCKDKNSNKFIEPLGFQQYILGDVMFAPKGENLDWYAFVVIHWSNTIRNTSSPFGHMLMKRRQLQKIGYKPIFVIWNEFLDLTPEARRLYILDKINV